MTALCFVDSNILVYAFDRDEPDKRNKARALVEELGSQGRLILSSQVLREYYAVVTGKLSRPVTPETAARAVGQYARFPVVPEDARLVQSAIDRHRRGGFSFWDALIVEAALKGRAKVLYTEDMQHGREADGLRIENPFE